MARVLRAKPFPPRRRTVLGEKPLRRRKRRDARGLEDQSRPAQSARDAVLVERMSRAGAILLGAVNMGEYAYDFTGENAHYGPAKNPLDPTRMSGGSSGGSGTAVGANLAQISLASDTNGSIRVPSSFCGLYGLKPTYGRLPRTRTFPFCESLDHLGPIARSPLDLALAFDAIQGHDAHDGACVPRPVELISPELSKGLTGLRVAVAGGYFQTNAEPHALEAVARVAKVLGASSVIDVPDADKARASAFLITNAESSAFHLQRLRTRATTSIPTRVTAFSPAPCCPPPGTSTPSASAAALQKP